MNTTQKKSKSSIKIKLLAIIIPLMAIAVSLLIIISYTKSKTIITNSANDLLETSSKKQVNQIDSWLNENLASFSSIKASIENTQLNDSQLQGLLNNSYGYNSNYPEGIYIADENGKLLKAAKSTKSDKNVLDSTWYIQGLTRINMAFGKPYKNAEGKNIISASGILNDKSGKIKVLSVDLSLDKISIIVNSLTDMKNSESLLVDKNDKTILAYGDSALISTKLDSNNDNKFLKEVAEKLEKREYNSVELENNMVAFNQVEGTNWVLVSYVPTKSILAELLKLRTFMIIIAIISIIILAVLVERVVQIVIKPIKKLTDTIIAMTHGDFTVDVELKGNDEISVMLESVKEFIKVMRGMINNIGIMSADLSVQAEGSNAISKELYDSSKIQSQSMESLNLTVEQLATSVSEVAQNTTTLANVVSTTRDDSINVDEKMKETIAVSEKGRQDMEKVNVAMANIRDSIRSLEGAIGNVGKSSNEITNIVNVIGSIAEQTNLLSLNASIEAARAGEAGKGFAVVAMEIGKLAKTSSDSVKDISELVSGINKLVSDTVSQARESTDHIAESSYLISGTVDTFDSIFDMINETNKLIQGMIDKIGNLDEVAASVAAIAEEQAASSEEILATSEVMVTQANSTTQNSEKVAADAEMLAATADKLGKQVKIFKL
ncbi:methyl-accepting chemotaxis protein [Clostridium folliculivorans]|uniref:Methyl-accepting chemotaxis protein n=1 Tax=Clostridium folliculivorans TaxID=2886038 RepID=A0A9W5XZ74_9CLOT|nr:methyl-accepting chemotaxis protein [Clostridium folliculivorans]GKU23751.1 methyl-accepting chemotaxis protein [Clostridium folliculivorans]GKU29867.1 methyl-accepting chemotaxis protein [Clostridium folliculivorans]